MLSSYLQIFENKKYKKHNLLVFNQLLYLLYLLFSFKIVGVSALVCTHKLSKRAK